MKGERGARESAAGGALSELPDPNAISLGRYRQGAVAGQYLPYTDARHLILFGPTGCGKGTGLLIPNLLSVRDRSIIVVDPKGELAAVTARHRATLGDVIILNPFGVLGIPGHGFNPLASLDPDSPTFFDDAAGLGEALIKIDDHDPHWSESAQGLLVAYLMWEVLLAKRERRAPLLAKVRTLLTEPNVYKTDEEGKERLVAGMRITARKMGDEGGFQIQSLIRRFLRDTDEIANIQSTADRQTWWMLSTPMRENLAKNDIDFRDLKKRPTTVYIILPAERMRTHSVWLRLVIISALRSLYTAGGLRTLFILDEFAQLGHLPPVEDAFGLVRGYGVQLWPILQDLTQLQEIYEKRWETFMANAGVVQGFAPNDLTTADWMSTRAGDATEVVAGFNAGDSQGGKGPGHNQGMSYQQAKRRVFLSQEIMEMPKGGGLIFPAGTAKSIPFAAAPYWKIPELNARADPNPYYELARRSH
jgi:type IV secretion system protein VirD4